MLQEREDLIRQRAHAIWESEGCPDGRHEEHWARAEADVASEVQDVTPKKAAARKPKAEPGAEAPAPRARRKAAEGEPAAPRKRGKAAGSAT